MKKVIFLYFIIFLEGYIVLSAELLAIRQITPFVGSGTDTVSIIIAAVLMPLAIGYFTGGQFRTSQKGKRRRTVRKKLLSNIFIATIFFTFGLSYIFISIFFETLSGLGFQNRLLTTTIYALVFLVVPVFLLAQTIPLVSHFFNKEKLSQITGKMLFFSTVGSFMGALLSTLVLMAYIGVHHTTNVTIGCLALLFILLTPKKTNEHTIIIIGIFATSLFFNSNKAMQYLHIVENNQYNTIRVLEEKNGIRILSLNNNNSSAYKLSPSTQDKKETFGYVTYLNKNFIRPIQFDGPIRSILVIGAGGFTIGLEDEKNQYTFVDIDSSLKEVSEKYFLKQKLGKNKHFEPVPARGYLHHMAQTGEKFDLIIMDAYGGALTIPEHLVTKEFFQNIKNVSKENGIIISNFIASINFNNYFSMNLDNTLRSVFPHVTRQIMPKTYNGWSNDALNEHNVLYIYHNKKNQKNGIYTDNKNRVYYDKNKPVN